MAFANLSFETAEATSPELDSETQEVRLADQWTETISGEGWLHMIFSFSSTVLSGDYNDVTEKFGDPGGWTGVDEDYLLEYEEPPNASELLYMTFNDATTVEDFENEWSSNEGYLYELPTSLVEAPLEDVESQWGPFDGSNPDYATKVLSGASLPANQTYFESIGDITTEAFGFSGGAESFESNWDSNESYAFTFAELVTENFSFDDGSQEIEDFEETSEYSEYIIVDSTPPLGYYTVFLNGVPHIYSNPGDNINTIATKLSNLMANTPAADVIPTAVGAQIRLKPGSLPVDYTVDVEAPEATLIVNSPPFQNVWSSRFFMATI